MSGSPRGLWEKSLEQHSSNEIFMRPITLHASALSDAEYDLYTTALGDLAWSGDADDRSATGHDDAYYEQMTISLREARGWLRGRYAHVPPASIDSVSHIPGVAII